MNQFRLKYVSGLPITTLARIIIGYNINRPTTILNEERIQNNTLIHPQSIDNRVVDDDHPKFNQQPNHLYSNPVIIPGFNTPGNCSGYATRAAKVLFNLDYNKDDAWNLRYKNEIKQSKDKGTINLDDLKPGSLLGFYNPKSRHNTYIEGKNDLNDNPRKYTHIALYIGKEQLPNGENIHIIHHVFSKQQERESLSQFQNRSGCTLIEVLEPLNQ